MRKGFLLLLDTILALLVLLILIFSLNPPKPAAHFEELQTIQKIHDLELLWSSDGKFEITEMIQDTQKTFPFQGFEITVNEEVFQTPAKSKTCAVSSHMRFIDETLRVQNIHVFVYC